MKQITFLFLLITIFFQAQTKKVISGKVHWKAYKTLKTNAFSHFGTVGLKSGNLVFSNNEITGGTIVLDMKKIDAEDMNGSGDYKKQLEDHLKSEDFFNIKKFPYSTFKILSVKKNADKIYQNLVTGTLTIKNISKNISIPVKITQNNGVTTLESANFSFNRHDFGLEYNIFEDMLIKDNVDMQVQITAK